MNEIELNVMKMLGFKHLLGIEFVIHKKVKITYIDDCFKKEEVIEDVNSVDIIRIQDNKVVVQINYKNNAGSITVSVDNIESLELLD